LLRGTSEKERGVGIGIGVCMSMIYAIASAHYKLHVSARHGPVVAGVGRDLWRASPPQFDEPALPPDPSSSGTEPAAVRPMRDLLDRARVEAQRRYGLLSFDPDERLMPPYTLSGDIPGCAARVDLPRYPPFNCERERSSERVAAAEDNADDDALEVLHRTGAALAQKYARDKM
jgi:hypothetical protein